MWKCFELKCASLADIMKHAVFKRHKHACNSYYLSIYWCMVSSLLTISSFKQNIWVLKFIQSVTEIITFSLHYIFS